jgi:hypothetical protein
MGGGRSWKARGEDEVVANVLGPEGTDGDRSAFHRGGNPKVAGAATVEVEGMVDLESGDWLGGERFGEGGEGRGRGMAEGPAETTVPQEEGSWAGSGGGKSGNWSRE